ncbi:MAG: aminopeptidase [Muribaculaceae bacterium]|nr:aminopeptidase [Muribaculaceae bacterium]
MKKLFAIGFILTGLTAFGGNTDKIAPLFDDPDIVVPDSTGFKFTDVKVNPTTSVKNQNKSGTCWSFAATSFLEEDIMRRGGEPLDLSEMYSVRNCYIDKAKKYIRTGGKSNFSQGGASTDVLYVADNYGIIPDNYYPGLNYGEENHVHGELEAVMKAYLDAVLKNPNKKLSTAWLPGLIGILDAYLGEVPETFVVNGKTYTPREYADELGIRGDDFISLTSYTHHPFYESFAIEIPDNWTWAESMNIPMEEMKAAVDNALENGYTVCWSADVSEGGFQWRNGFALLPEEKSDKDLEGTELSRWVQLSAKDREKETYKIKGPVKERTVTQESRQKTFDNYETTDDHGMVIVGTAVDQEGNKYYKVKNSWDTNQLYEGYLYVSEPYFLEKTLSVLVNKSAVPAPIASKFK